MKYDDFIMAIISSYETDWIYDDEIGRYVFKDDIRIAIVLDRSDTNGEAEQFHEDWVKKFSDPKAYKKKFNLVFNGTIVEVFYTAAVDGYRMYIPYPSIKGMTISKIHFHIGRIINSAIRGYDYKEYIDTAGISVV
jgi:hypothetical protein